MYHASMIKWFMVNSVKIRVRPDSIRLCVVGSGAGGRLPHSKSTYCQKRVPFHLWVYLDTFNYLTRVYWFTLYLSLPGSYVIFGCYFLLLAPFSLLIILR
jgi:hypothetical protein